VNFEKGNYLAIREVTLSYTIPSSLYNKIGIDNLRVYATGSNLKYFTKYSGYSPEEGGLDTGRYPIPRSFIFGVNVTF
jgi:hypothetical protein